MRWRVIVQPVGSPMRFVPSEVTLPEQSDCGPLRARIVFTNTVLPVPSVTMPPDPLKTLSAMVLLTMRR